VGSDWADPTRTDSCHRRSGGRQIDTPLHRASA